MNVHASVGSAIAADCPVNSHNEWDPLEEIIVGRLEGATIPSDHPVVTCNIPRHGRARPGAVAGFRFPQIMIEPAQQELDGFHRVARVARREGDGGRTPVDHKAKFSTPHWSSRGFCNSCPRDCMLVIGDEIIETPMAWPCRYFETHSYREILKDYFRRGARWTRRRSRNSPTSSSTRIHLPRKASRSATSSPNSSRSSTPPISCAAAATCS